MRKYYISLALILCVITLSGFPFSKDKEPVPKEFPTFQDMLSYFNYNVHMIPVPIKEATLQVETLEASGWNDLIIDGKKYVGRLIMTQFMARDVDGIEDIKFICSVAPGERTWTKTITTTCSTAKISANLSFSIELAEIIGLSLGMQGDLTTQQCYTVEVGREYTFPDYCEGYNCAEFYIGTGFDLYEVTLEIAPYEILDRVALRLCKRQCNKIKDVDKAQQCLEECEREYGYQPNFEKISTYYTDVYVPKELHWAVCLNIDLD